MLAADGSTTHYMDVTNTTAKGYSGSGFHSGKNSDSSNNTARATCRSMAQAVFGSSHILTHREFKFKNIECNEHLKRDCQKNSDDTRHKWSSRLKKLIGTATKDRDEAIDRGESGFSREYIGQFLEYGNLPQK